MNLGVAQATSTSARITGLCPGSTVDTGPEAGRYVSPEGSRNYLSTAFRHAVSGRPGPVFLDIPDDVGSGEIAVQSLSPRIHSAIIQETSAGKAELPQNPEDYRSTGWPGTDWDEVRRDVKRRR